jgi:hypothetical protein
MTGTVTVHCLRNGYIPAASASGCHGAAPAMPKRPKKTTAGPAAYLHAGSRLVRPYHCSYTLLKPCPFWDGQLNITKGHFIGGTPKITSPIKQFIGEKAPQTPKITDYQFKRCMSKPK